MLTILLATGFESIIQDNMAYFAIGHVGLVLVLLVVFLNMGKPEAVTPEPQERDEDAFDYDTEQGSLFKTPGGDQQRASLKLEQESESSESEDDLEEPVVFNSQISEQTIPEPEVSPESEAPEEAEEPAAAEPETEEEPEDPKADRLREILSDETEKAIIAINRDESILDLNSTASVMFQYGREDIEGKKIDEIIFLEDSSNESNSQQRANAQRKDGSMFPVSVELEMADRQHGIITVKVFSKDAESDQEEVTQETPIKLEEENEITEEVIEPTPEPEPEPEPIPEPAPARAKPLPPPPRPKVSSEAKLLAQNETLKKQLAQTHGLDSKSIEMFSSQLNQPLQSIAKLAELIASDEAAIPHLKKYAVAIQAKSNRMMSQIEETSQLVSAQQGAIELLDNPFNLSKMLEDLVDMASNIPANPKPKIQLPKSEQDLILISDKNHFEKVLSSLLNLTIQGAENELIELQLKYQESASPKPTAKNISFEGQELQINSINDISVSAEFPSDDFINRFYDASINRPDNPLVQKLQASTSLKNHTTSIRLLKELCKSLGGTLRFEAPNNDKGKIEFSVSLPSVPVASYPA